jgi:hypothetical protein
MAAGQTPEEAQKNAENVDAVAGIGAMLILPGRSSSVPEVVIDSPELWLEPRELESKRNFLVRMFLA